MKPDDIPAELLKLGPRHTILGTPPSVPDREEQTSSIAALKGRYHRSSPQEEGGDGVRPLSCDPRGQRAPQSNRQEAWRLLRYRDVFAGGTVWIPPGQLQNISCLRCAGCRNWDGEERRSCSCISTTFKRHTRRSTTLFSYSY